MPIVLTHHEHIALGCTGEVSPHVSLGTVSSRVKGSAGGDGSLSTAAVFCNRELDSGRVSGILRLA
jgi:hypothetical protein